MRNSLIYLTCNLFWLLVGFDVCALELCGNLKQGEPVSGYAPKATEVVVNDVAYKVDKDGRFLFSLARDADETAKISVVYHDDAVDNYILPVASAKWDIQQIEGVEQCKVTPVKEDEAEILREQKDVRKALSVVDNGNISWQKGFILPVEGIISGHFGNQRIFNGVPKNPHSGTDIAVAEGTPVKAAGDGIVILSGGNYFYSGNMVIIDHGYGLQTIYMHLKEAKVAKGDYVKKGEVIGLAGKTGRATGAHLHWGASLHNIRFRPHALLEMEEWTCREYVPEGEEILP